MNRNKLKAYAPKARRDFIRAVTEQAAKVGIAKDHIEPVEVKGDVAIIGGRAFPRKMAEQRRKLDSRINLHGFDQVMEGGAYTWFNRFAAIRYMEVHEYLDHGYRVLSHPEGKDLPEILEKADHVDLPGLDRGKVIDLKLDGTKDAELYRMLLIAQCNALNAAMPFLFEKIDDETELLLPDNLLHSDSLIRQMVAEIDEEDWQEIEIIGWLYQFYISEKKDQVIGKVVKSEDIPAATQLFTPNWIVKYMVQNSLGHQWLATYPDSPLKTKMDYYIEPAEQTDEVQAQLAEITPKELNPEEITLMDPACGSGHILVEAYELFKAIYEERGYARRDIPRLILEKNLYGLEIDDRAAQLAGFALLMKARADDRRILESSPTMNVMAIQSNKGLDAAEIARHLIPKGRVELVPSDDLMPDTLPQPGLSANVEIEVKEGTIKSLIDLFEDAKTFGSLITVPDNIEKALPALRGLVEQPTGGDLFKKRGAEMLGPLLTQAELLGGCYDCVVTNPPYMGSRTGMNEALKKLIQDQYFEGRGDTYSAFIMRANIFARAVVSIIVQFSWMFLSSFSDFRRFVNSKSTIISLIQNDPGVFSGFGTSILTFRPYKVRGSVGTYIHLDRSILSSRRIGQAVSDAKRYKHNEEIFESIPAAPLCFMLSSEALGIFAEHPSAGSRIEAREGLITGDNDRFLRYWHEVQISGIDFEVKHYKKAIRSHKKWFPYVKGGEFRKWFGNNDFVVNWANDGHDVRSNIDSRTGRVRSHNYNGEYGFREGLAWTSFSSHATAFRYVPTGFMFDAKGPMAFGDRPEILHFCGLGNSLVGQYFLNNLSPSADYKIKQVLALPFVVSGREAINEFVCQCTKLAKSDWESFETSWNFESLPILRDELKGTSVQDGFVRWRLWCERNATKMRQLEESINHLLIETYGLSEELDAEVSKEDITLAFIDQTEGSKCLVSYAIGCMMGRYSLDGPGLIYANGGNEGFDASKYATFPADDDGVIPVTDVDWFDDDAARRFSEFLAVAWSPETLTENLQFVADSLSQRHGETPLDTIRRYLSTGFYKDHLKTYKRRPIYWLFSSGKQKAFECLVYLHRYNESTLSRVRMEYVIPLQSKFAARLVQLDGDIASATSTANRRKLDKEKDSLLKKQAELVEFDYQLRHYTDQRIALDLDDGVKVNYGKFGDLLAEVKAITGKE